MGVGAAVASQRAVRPDGRFLAVASAFLVSGCTDTRAPAEFVFKRAGDVDISASVYRPAQRDTAQPVAVWIHGGALIAGNRDDIDKVPDLKAGLLNAGCIVVSIDYRLAPETRLPEIVSDVEDAIAWIRRDGPRLFGADPARVAVIGNSSGGYLAMTTGHRVRPPPQALVAFFGYGDLTGAWYSRPSTYARHRELVVDSGEAWKQVGGPPVSDSRHRPVDPEAFYQFLRRTGGWPRAVSGWDPRTEAARYDAFMPVKNVTPSWPPTLLIHGTADTDVPYEQSAIMAEQFRVHGVNHRLIPVEGAEHGLRGALPETVAAVHQAAVRFVAESIGCVPR